MRFAWLALLLLASPAFARNVLISQDSGGAASNIAFDAASEGMGTTTLSWTHTPVGTPRGVLVFCMATVVSTDVFTAASYGGTAMTAIASGSDSVGEFGFNEGYFLGASIPTGAQTVACTTSGGTAKHAVAFTVTANADTQTAGTDSCVVESLAGSGIDDPSCSITTISGSSWAAAGLYNGQIDEAQVTAGTDFTLSLSEDHGSWITTSEYRTTQLTSGDQTVAFTTVVADDTVMVAIAIEQIP